MSSESSEVSLLWSPLQWEIGERSFHSKVLSAPQFVGKGCNGMVGVDMGMDRETIPHPEGHIRKDVLRRLFLSLLLTLFPHTHTQSPLSKSLVLQRTG